MRILIDASSITRRKTGTGIYTEGLLNSLLMLPDVERVIAVGGDINRESLVNQEKLIHQLPGDTGWHYLLNNVWTGNRYNWEADVAFFPNYFMPFAFPIRSIVTIHDVSFLSHPECYCRRMRTWYSHRIRQTVGHADWILTVSESSRLDIIRYLGISPERIRVIEPGSSFTQNDKPGVSQKNNNNSRFLYIGTIEPRKNIINMLRGFTAAKSPDLQLRLAGQIHCSHSYWRRVESLVSADKRIQYLGYISDDRLQKELSHCDTLVNLSYIEGFGLPVMEALLRGKQCLISESPALLKLAGRHGIKVYSNNINNIAGGFEICKSLEGFDDDLPELRAYYNWQRFSRQLAPMLTRESSMMTLASGINPNPGRDAPLPGFTCIEQAIVKALCYSAVFKCPLTPEQLHKRLPGEECTLQVLMDSLKHLCREYPEFFLFDGRYVYLRQLDMSAEKRDSDLSDNAVFIKRYTNVIRWMKRLPWIRGIYYSGGTVHGSHLVKKDLDLFIVASANRVWLLYTLLKVFAFVARKRSILCFNYVVDESALVIRHQRDLYTAHQLACMRPALSDGDMPEPLCYNQWVYDFFPNLDKSTDVSIRKAISDSGFWYWMNMIMMGLWTGWWNRKGLKNCQGGILWDFHRIKLHTRDHRPFVYEKYQSLLQDVNLRIRSFDKQRGWYGYKYSAGKDPGSVVSFPIADKKEKESR